MTVKVLEPLEFGESREIVKVDKTPHQLFEAIWPYQKKRFPRGCSDFLKEWKQAFSEGNGDASHACSKSMTAKGEARAAPRTEPAEGFKKNPQACMARVARFA